MKYQEAAKLWGAARLRREKIDFEEVTSVYFSTEADVYCDTCGPEVSHEGTVTYNTRDGKSPPRWRVGQVRSFTFQGLDEILKELFELSEEA